MRQLLQRRRGFEVAIRNLRRKAEEALAGFVVERVARVSQCTENEVLFMLEAIELQQVEFQPSLARGQLLKNRYPCLMPGQVKPQTDNGR